MRDSCARYVKQVGRRMCCPREEKVRLLEGLKTEFAEAFAAGETPSLEELCARFGAPSAMAAELQSVLPEDELARCRQRRRNRLCTGLVACAMVIVLLAGYLVFLGSKDVYAPPDKEKVTYDNEFIVED